MSKKTKYNPEMLLREAEAHVNYGVLARKYGLTRDSVKVAVCRLRKKYPGTKPGDSIPEKKFNALDYYELEKPGVPEKVILSGRHTATIPMDPFQQRQNNPKKQMSNREITDALRQGTMTEEEIEEYI